MQKDSAEKLTSGRPAQAIAELIWIGLDAEATCIEVTSELGNPALNSIVIQATANSGVAVDARGHVCVADRFSNAMKMMPPGCASSACVTTLGGGFSFPIGVAVDGAGDVYVADRDNLEGSARR